MILGLGDVKDQLTSHIIVWDHMQWGKYGHIDWCIRIQNCYIIKPQKSLEEYQTPFPPQRVGSGNETKRVCGIIRAIFGAW